MQLIVSRFVAAERIENVFELAACTFRNQVTEVFRLGSTLLIREGFRKRVTNVKNVWAVASCADVSHTVGISSIHVAAIEHVTLQLSVLAKLVLASTIPGHYPLVL